MSSSLPVLWRSARQRCASAASAKGQVRSMRSFSSPAASQRNRSPLRLSSSSRSMAMGSLPSRSRLFTLAGRSLNVADGVGKVREVFAAQVLQGILDGRMLEVLHILADEERFFGGLGSFEIDDDRGKNDGVLRPEVICESEDGGSGQGNGIQLQQVAISAQFQHNGFHGVQLSLQDLCHQNGVLA